MDSQEDLVKLLSGAEPCQLQSLLFDRVSKPAVETQSSQLHLPKGVSQKADTEALSLDDLCKLAFTLLLKSYIRADSIICGLITTCSPWTPGATSKLPVACVLKADFDAGATLFNNLSKLRSIPVTGPDSVIVGKHFYDLETEASFQHFNTTLCLTNSSLGHEETIENVFNSDLVLFVDRGSSADSPNDQIRITLQYSTNLLDGWCAKNVLCSFGSILSTVASNLSCKLQGVNLISNRDEKLIRTWNAKLPPAARQTLNEHFEKTFRDNVDKEVVYTTSGCFSYGELDDLSTVLALRLVKLGLKRNMVVPICMNKSRWGTVAMTAVWKAGGALTSMDPTHPDERLFAIMTELDAKIVISDVFHASRFEREGVHVISDLESLPQLLEKQGLPISRTDAWRMAGVKPDDWAFVAFTSGSSGRPKGVIHSHDRLTSEHLSYLWNKEYNGGARLLQFASYAYIASVGENFRALLHGATICVPSETERTSALAEFINRSGSTRSYMTPSMIRTIDPEDVPSLKHLVVGGEPIDRDLENIWAGHVSFIHLYGASEGGFMIKEQGNPQYEGKGLFPVGGLSWLVDPQDVNKLVPVGAVGEIIFESHELAAGYLNDPERTAKSFIEPPVWAQERHAATGCRYLRMGDLGRYETDGSMSIYGRADTQVKIHGQRVELLDIEFSLRKSLPPGSEGVVELVKPFDAPDRPLLTAFLCINPSHETLDDNTQEIISSVRKGLEKVLPLHMVPRAFIILKALPMNSSNKTDRKRLRENASKQGYKNLIKSSQRTSTTCNGHLDPPKRDTERILAELWGMILLHDVESIGRRDDFLALGGDSLAAIRLVSAVRAKGLELTTQNVLMFPVLQDMAELASRTKANGVVDTARLNGINHDSSSSGDLLTVRATDFQDWAVSVGALNGGWIDHLGYDLSGRLDVKRLEQVCKELVEAHAILRAVFKAVEEKVYMDIPAYSSLRFDVHEVTIDKLESKTREIYSAERICPLGSPIVRFYLITASSNYNRLIIRISHAQYDAFCAQAIGEHLRLLYFGQPLPQTLPFHEYARRVQDEGTVQEAEAYWREYLKDSQMPKLMDSCRPGSPYNNALDQELTRVVAEPNLRQHGINTVVVAKAAWALTIAALSRSSDVVFGDFISGRQIDIPHIDTVIGPCVNFTPVRVHAAPGLTNLELMKQVRADLISSIPHQSLGFRQIIQKCTHWDDSERFSSIFNFVNVETASSATETWTAGDDADALRVETFYEERQHDKTDLWLLCLPGHLASTKSRENESTKTLEMHLRFSERVFEAGVIEKIMTLYCQTLDLLATTPDAPLCIPQFLEG